jgi:hypothetical protein
MSRCAYLLSAACLVLIAFIPGAGCDTYKHDPRAVASDPSMKGDSRMRTIWQSSGGEATPAPAPEAR